MSESYPSPFYTDRGIGQAANALAQAFLPNPLREARMQGLAANAELDRARAGEIARRGSSADAVSAIARGGDVSPAAVTNMLAAMAASGDPNILRVAGEFMRAFGGAAGADPNRMAQLQGGAGQDWISTEVGRRLQEQNNLTQAFGVADRQAAAQRYAVDQQELGRDRRMAPEINPGNVVVVPPNSPLAPRARADGRIPGAPLAPTMDATRADAARRYAAGEGTPEERARWRDVFSPSIGAAEVRGGSAARPPLDINGADGRAIDEQIGASMPPGSALSPEAAQIVRARTAELYQQNRNLVAAAQQAVQEFMSRNPPRTDSSLNPFSSRTFGVPTAGGPVRRDPGPSSAPPAPAEGAAPATGGYRLPNGQVIPEGATIRQGGRTYIIRGGQPVPLA